MVPVWTGGASGIDERERMVPFLGGGTIPIEELEGLASEGDAVAMYWLAKLFLGEDSLDEDPEEAAGLLAAAADQGYPEAMSLLGELMARGYGTEKDEPGGLRLMMEAADRGGWDVLGPAAPGSPPQGLEEEMARWRRRRNGPVEGAKARGSGESVLAAAGQDG